MRYLLPPGLTAEEERAIAAALDQYFGESTSRPGPWALAGRVDALRLGALQIRHQAERPWGEAVRHAYTRRGIEPRMSRGAT